MNKTKKKSSTKQLKITKKRYNDIEYPYYNYQINKNTLLKYFKNLKNYKYKLLNKNPVNRKINKFKNKYIIFEENYYKSKDLYNITDYFSQKCRVRCIYNAREKKSVLDLFTENKDTIYSKLSKYGHISYLDINEYIFKNYKQCTNFNTTIVISLLKLLKPKKVLDMSSGWGDRLVGAIAYKCEYTGVDPSNCMAPIYKKIINTLAKKEERKNYKVIKSGFETANIKENYYDLMFSSPPFFDLEIYEDAAEQSIEKFNSLEQWKSGFLYPSILKSYKSLKYNGYLALYISDYTGYSYTNDMKIYIKENIKELKYQGDIHWWDKNNKKAIRTIFIWQKKH